MLGVFQLCCMRISVPLGCCLVEIVIAASFCYVAVQICLKKKSNNLALLLQWCSLSIFFVAPF